MANVRRVSLNLNADKENEEVILNWIDSTSYAPSKIKDILYNYIIDNDLNNNTLRIATPSNRKKQVVSDCSSKLQSGTLSNNEKHNETVSNNDLQEVITSNNFDDDLFTVEEVTTKVKDVKKLTKKERALKLGNFVG